MVYSINKTNTQIPMSHDSKLAKKCGSLDVNGNIILAKSNVTQLTSITTGVLTTTGAGVITTVSSTLSADSATSFVVSNPSVTSSSVVMLTTNNYSGNQGLPSVRVQSVSAGQFTIVLSNNHSSAALNGIVKIGYLVL